MKITDIYYKCRKRLGLAAMSPAALRSALVLYPMEDPSVIVRHQDERLLTRLLLTVLAAAAGLGLSMATGSEKGVAAVLAFGFIALGGQVAMEYEHRKEDLEKRRQQLELDYAGLTSDFSVLTGAGLSIRRAWEKLVTDYREDRKKGASSRYLYEEMLLALRQMDGGISETEAISRFGERIGLTSYLRFVRLLELSRKNGRTELTKALSAEAAEAFSLRLSAARRMGEKIQIKLLIPMMILFALVLAILIIPAFLSW